MDEEDDWKEVVETKRRGIAPFLAKCFVFQ